MLNFAKTWKVLFLLPLFWGCTKPNVEMQAMSSSLQQLKATSDDPTANFESSRYLLFKGRCISIVSELQIRFDNHAWLSVPSSPDAAVNGNYVIGGNPYPYTETAPVGETYDVNCSDGTYTFWVYEHQFEEWLFNLEGYTPGTNVHVDTISVRGIAGAFATEPYVYNMSGHNTPPTNIGIFKRSQPYGAMANQCTEIAVELHADNGSYASFDTASTVAITGSNLNDTNLFANFADCMADVNAFDAAQRNAVVIPADKNEVRLAYKVPSLTVGTTVSFNISSAPAGLSYAPAIVFFDIKNGTDKYLEVSLPYRMLADMCYKAQVWRRFYGGGAWASPSIASLTGAPSEFKFYNAGDCSNQITSVNFSTSDEYKDVYVKVDKAISDANSSTSAFFAITSSGYDHGQARTSYDKSGDDVLDHILIYGSDTISASTPSTYTVARFNRDGTPLALASGMSINLSRSSGSGFFCSIGASCASPGEAIPNVPIPAGEHQVMIKFNPNGDAMTLDLQISGSGVSNYSYTIQAQ